MAARLDPILPTLTDDPEVLAPLLTAYREEEQAFMRGGQYPIQNLRTDRRREIFARLQDAAEAYGIRLDICSCNISGTWPARPAGRPSGRTTRATQPALIS